MKTGQKTIVSNGWNIKFLISELFFARRYYYLKRTQAKCVRTAKDRSYVKSYLSLYKDNLDKNKPATPTEKDFHIKISCIFPLLFHQSHKYEKMGNDVDKVECCKKIILFLVTISNGCKKMDKMGHFWS